jgi:hypothetical protein
LERLQIQRHSSGRLNELKENNPTSTDISIGYPIDVSADPVGYPSWMSYGCLQDILMSSPMDGNRTQVP